MFTHPEKNIESAYISEGMKVADFGAGIGYHSIAVARRVGSSGGVYSIEIQTDLLSKLAAEAHGEKLQNVHTILGNFEKRGGSTLADQSMDRVLLINTLFQVENKVGALNEAKRVLKSNGRLILIDWEESFGQIGPHKDQVIKKSEATNLLEKAGFKLQTEFAAGSHHYGLIFKLS